MWSLDTLDWQRPKPKDIIDRVLNHIKPGTVVLCHDIHPGTVEAMPFIIEGLQQKGYHLKTISEMLAIEYPNH
jgi:peptidoglycan/xylan/chitin deacetylase (PgdA/CDA1 family)